MKKLFFLNSTFLVVHLQTISPAKDLSCSSFAGFSLHKTVHMYGEIDHFPA